MSDIVKFLRARLDGDEAAALAAVIPAHEGPNAYKPHPALAEWSYDGGEVEYVQTPEMLAHKYPDTIYVTCDSEGLSPSVDDSVGPHIARHDPARVLREVEAKRRILYTCDTATRMWLHARTEEYADGVADPGDTILRALASVYADHPDFDGSWAL